VHLLDFPYEEDADDVRSFFIDSGIVKNVRHQKYLSRSDVCTGTCLIDVVLNEPPSRIANINGVMCHVWYKGHFCTSVPDSVPRGPGRWKLNISILSEQSFKDSVL